VSIRKTSDEARARYVATCDQYRMMAWSLGQWTTGRVVTPDARGLVQELPGAGGRRVPTAIWRDVFWLHMQRVALVTEELQGRETERRLRRAVKKIGIDPHFAYSWMLLCLAWTRIYGTDQLLPIGPDPEPWDREVPGNITETERGYAVQIQQRIEAADELGPLGRKAAGLAASIGLPLDDPNAPACCGTCTQFRARDGVCMARDFIVKERQPACEWYVPQPMPEDRW
jgi:hypothetical protein